MKTIIILAALIICLNSNLSAQSSAEVNAKVTESFGEHFNGATRIQWQKVKNLSVAIFLYEERAWIAYFDQSGDLLASARRVKDNSQLPVIVQESLSNFKSQKSAKTGPLTMGYVYEVLPKNGETYYYIPMESATQSLSVSISNSGYAAINKKENRIPAMIEGNKALLAKKN